MIKCNLWYFILQFYRFNSDILNIIDQLMKNGINNKKMLLKVWKKDKLCNLHYL